MIKVLFLSMILVSPSGFAWCVDSSGYTEKLILSAKWGKEPGEFGVYKEPAGENSVYGPELRRAPMCLKVKNGNIYILDGENLRIQKFDLNGKFISSIKTSFRVIEMTVDDDGEVFAYSGNADVVNGSRIERFDTKGKKIEEVKINPKEVSTANGLYVDMDELHSKYDGKIIGKLKNKKNPRKSLVRNARQLREEGEIRVYKAGKIKKRGNLRAQYYLEIDRNNLMYVLNRKGRDYSPDCWVEILDADGNLYRELRVHNEYYQLVGGWIENYFDVGEDGSVFQLWTTSAGVFVSRWVAGK